VVVGAAGRGRDRSGGGGRALRVAADLPRGRQDPAHRSFHRGRAAGGDGRCVVDATGGHFHGAGHVPRGRAAGRFGIPPRTGIQHRTVRRTAARAVFHHGGDGREPAPAGTASVDGGGPGDPAASVQGAGAGAGGPLEPAHGQRRC